VIRKTTLKDAHSCYSELMGATGADFAAVGEFDPEALSRAVGELFGAWRTPYPSSACPGSTSSVRRSKTSSSPPTRRRGAARRRERENARRPSGLRRAAAGQLSARRRLDLAHLDARAREGRPVLQHRHELQREPFDETASFRVSAIFARRTARASSSAIREELARAVKDGFSAEELEAGKKAILEARRLARTQDRALAGRIGSYLFLKRTFAWDIELESKIAALTPAQVNEALRKYLDPAKLSL